MEDPKHAYSAAGVSGDAAEDPHGIGSQFTDEVMTDSLPSAAVDPSVEAARDGEQSSRPPEAARAGRRLVALVAAGPGRTDAEILADLMAGIRRFEARNPDAPKFRDGSEEA
jgi:hypothetical protein